MTFDNQEVLFYDSIYDALKEVIKRVGGNKAVGQKLWPEMAGDKVAGKLSDCLNETRAEKLSPEQFILLLKMGREIGCHSAVNYVMRDIGYMDPTPLNIEDQKERTQREFVEAMKHVHRLSNDLKSMGILND